MKSKFKKGDLVEIITGKDKGKQGKVIQQLSERIMVEGLNMVKRHTKPSQKAPQGGIVEKEAGLHISNVLLVDPKTNRGGRIKIVRKGEKRTRVFKKSGTELKA
jgi:large subunit ribosomal protein L24